MTFIYKNFSILFNTICIRCTITNTHENYRCSTFKTKVHTPLKIYPFNRTHLYIRNNIRWIYCFHISTSNIQNYLNLVLCIMEKSMHLPENNFFLILNTPDFRKGVKKYVPVTFINHPAIKYNYCAPVVTTANKPSKPLFKLNYSRR